MTIATMGMRETVGSLRTYFFIAGAIGVLRGIQGLGEAAALGAETVPASWTAAVWFSALKGVGLGVAYIVAGTHLRSALARGAGWIKGTLLIGIALLVIELTLLSTVLNTDELRTGGVAAVVVSLLITAYLLANLRRLAAEAMAMQPPIARVV